MGKIGTVSDRVGSAHAALSGNQRAESVATHSEKVGGPSRQTAEPAIESELTPLRRRKNRRSHYCCLTRFGTKSPLAISSSNSLVLGLGSYGSFHFFQF